MSSGVERVSGSPAAGCEGPASAVATAQRHLEARRWAEAAEALAPVRSQSPGLEMQWRLARNFAALERCRREVYERLIASSGSGTCRPALSRRGEATLIHSLPPREAVVLSPGGEPAEALRATLAAFEDDLRRGRCLALCGVGDGYLLSHLAANPPPLQLGQQQCIHIIEPHAEVLLGAMMIHQWWEEGGPIADRRFQWWPGSQWAAKIHAALDRDPYLPYPERPVRLSAVGEEIDAALREALGALIEGEKRLAERVEKRYAQFTPRFAQPHRGREGIPRLAEPHRGRGPRVLLLTTRFSTVLQHSTRDLAAAFEQLGWSVRVPIEPSDWQRNSRRNLLRHLADFQPDLVVQIDHLRHEHRGLFPPQLPFACWIQDDLPNLTRREAGNQIGPRDFVLTTTAAVYEHDYGYPARQCLYMPKCTRLPDLDSIPRVEAADVVYVSNASASAEALIEQVAAEHARQPVVAELIRVAGADLVARYARDEVIFTVGEISGTLRQSMDHLGIRPTDDGAFAMRLAARLFATVNNALYRQQALRWAASACGRLGLSLGVYGEGWEQHPHLAPFARGPVKYGRDLEALTRSARINLQIVPYMYQHQRWFDGVAAGGFFLIRAHPMDTLAGEVAEFIERCVDPAVSTLAEALGSLDPAARQEFEAILERREMFDDHRGADPVAVYRRHQREGRNFVYERPAFLADVRFDDEATLGRLLEAFSGDEARRREITFAQRRFVEEHFTYEAGLRRVLARMTDLIRSEIDSEAPCPAPADGVSRCA